MCKLGFTPSLNERILDKGDKAKNIVYEHCKLMGIINGIAVYYVKIGDCALRYIYIYTKKATADQV
jgi:hypothetical protein